VSTLNEPSKLTPEAHGWPEWMLVREMWASLAISAMWLAVMLDSLFGPDMVFTNGTPGIGNTTTIPSGVVLGLFALIGTWVVARYAFGRPRSERE
jgi:hypothetical protein